MPLIRIPKSWEMPERLATPEDVYINRRTFLKAMGFTGLGAFGLVTGCLKGENESAQLSAMERDKMLHNYNRSTIDLYPATRNKAFTIDRPLTEESVAARYNNFYEFTLDKEKVWQLAESFKTRPWQIEVSGLVNKPKIYEIDELIRMMPLEERLYRFRCVEAWSMAVPWTGFPMRKFIELVEPKSTAKYVRMVTFLKLDQAPGQKTQPWYPWPYFEGLTMAEAMNELTLLVTGIYGHPLPKQHGAPMRLITPWKYGYKSIKSIVSIEFTDKQPATFWNTVTPREYGFFSNINPNVPHPRWSQATERVIGSDERVPTLLYNGYGEYVTGMYTGKEF